MKRVLSAVGLVLAFASSCLAFPMSGIFDPVSIISNLAEQEAKESIVSPAFLSLVKIFNETHEKQITEKQAKKFWRDNYAPYHGIIFNSYYDLSTVEDAIKILNELHSAIGADDDIKMKVLKNSRRSSSFGYRMCSPEDLAEELKIGRIAFVYFDAELTGAQSDISNRMLSSLYPIFGQGLYETLKDVNYSQMDVGVAVLGINGDKAIVWGPEGEKEMDLSNLVDIADYVLVLESEKLKERQQKVQEKNESEAYLEKIRQEVKSEKQAESKK